jgi:hypothetical protein
MKELINSNIITSGRLIMNSVCSEYTGHNYSSKKEDLNMHPEGQFLMSRNA